MARRATADARRL